MRNELKFYLNRADACVLESRLSAVLRKDSHTTADGSYFIRSLYFDDADVSARYDKINGCFERKKYRLRYYNSDPTFIRFEKKEKIGNQCLKTASVIDPDTAQKIAKCSFCSTDSNDPLLNEFSRLMHAKRFRPLVFVDYRRKAFLHPLGKVRITLDDHLSASPFHGSFFEDPYPRLPVIRSDEVILEIKYDRHFPPYLAELLLDIPKQNCSVSKYCKCLEVIE